jgi:hypothetical protein
MPAVATERGYRVDVVLPVAGTDIASRVLAGAWEVRVGLDPADAPLATTILTLE